MKREIKKILNIKYCLPAIACGIRRWQAGIFLILFLVLGLNVNSVKASGSCSAALDPSDCSITVDETSCAQKGDYIYIEGSTCNTGQGLTPGASGFKEAPLWAEQAAKNAGVQTDKTLEQKVASVINTALSIIGVLFLLLMVYGGYIWMIARGDEQMATKAKNIITMAVIGLAIVFAAYAITFFITSRLVSAS